MYFGPSYTKNITSAINLDFWVPFWPKIAIFATAPIYGNDPPEGVGVWYGGRGPPTHELSNHCKNLEKKIKKFFEKFFEKNFEKNLEKNFKKKFLVRKNHKFFPLHDGVFHFLIRPLFHILQIK